MANLPQCQCLDRCHWNSLQMNKLMSSWKGREMFQQWKLMMIGTIELPLTIHHSWGTLLILIKKELMSEIIKLPLVHIMIKIRREHGDVWIKFLWKFELLNSQKLISAFCLSNMSIGFNSYKRIEWLGNHITWIKPLISGRKHNSSYLLISLP